MIYWLLKKLFPKLTMTRKESLETIKALKTQLTDKKQKIKEVREVNTELRDFLCRTTLLLKDMADEIEQELYK